MRIICGNSTSANGDHGAGNEMDGCSIPSSQSFRNFVAGKLTSEQLELYKMYATAGLDEYKPFLNFASLDELKQYSKRSGKSHGPGKCFWADEFALRTISDGLCLTLLIIDDQATRRGGGGSGRKRRRNDADASSSPVVDNRFVRIGNHDQVVVLHRSRRQHYNAVVVDDQPVMVFAQLPSNVQSLWSANSSKEKETKSESEPSTKCGSSNDEAVMEKILVPEQERNDASISSTSTATSLGNFYCGCAGFSSSSWVGNFYPKSIVGNNSERQLSWYQQQFRTVEINSTFYGIPSESTVNKWKKLFAKSFKVVMKAPKGLTHEKSQLDCTVLSAFLSRMQPLGENLSVILIQCPRTLTVTLTQLEQLKRVLDDEASWYKGQLAFEFRNESTYFNEEVRRFLKQNSFALVMHPNSLGRSTVGTSASGRGNCNPLEYQPEQLSKVAAAGAMDSNIVYIRLHGSNDEHRGEYTTDQLTEMAAQIHAWRTRGIEVFCFILNDLEPTESQSPSPKKSDVQPWDKWCAMPKNAKQLESIVYGLSKEDVPDAPKKPKNTLLSFFGKKGK